ncbi:MAG: hypothetical protein ACOC47_03715 [Alkalispirochaetaceae bacterium]
MSLAKSVTRILHLFANRTGSSRLRFDGLATFANRYARKHQYETPELDSLIEEDQRVLIQSLEGLERSNVVVLERDDTGNPSVVYYPAFFRLELDRFYSRVGEEPERPFPQEEDLPFAPPSHQLKTVSVTEDIIEWIGAPEYPPNLILNIRFPGIIKPMLITPRILQERMLSLCMQKMRVYLRNRNNSGYIRAKLQAVFTGREMMVTEFIHGALTNPESLVEQLKNPNEFTFHFWTQLSSLVVNEYEKKKELMDDEHSICQASYILGYLCVYNKGVSQRTQQKEEALKMVRQKLDEEPYVFRISEVEAFSDEKGVPLTKRCPKEEIYALVSEMSTPQDETSLPELFPFSPDGSDRVYIMTHRIIPYVLKERDRLRNDLARFYRNGWAELLKNDRKLEMMTDDDAFDAHVKKAYREKAPIAFTLTSFDLLFLASEVSGVPEGVVQELRADVIDTRKKSLRPWSVIFKLDRKQLYNEARLMLPFWMAVPILRGIVRLLKKMFTSGEGGRKSDTAEALESDEQARQREESEATKGMSKTEKQERLHFKKAVVALQQEYLRNGGSVEERLQELREEWNPLLDETARQHLVEDVNALCRDTLRRMKVTNRKHPPDKARIEALSERIAENEAFDLIRKRSAFRNYLELYMLSLLEKVR